MRSPVSLLWIVALCFSLSAGGAPAQTLPVAEPLISLNSEQGSRLLLESEDNRAYWPLSIQFVTQKNQAFCGVASIVMVLNALGIPAPSTPEFEPYKTFTQDNLLNEYTEKVLPVSVLAKIGMTLDQIGGILNTYSVKAHVRHADEDIPRGVPFTREAGPQHTEPLRRCELPSEIHRSGARRPYLTSRGL